MRRRGWAALFTLTAVSLAAPASQAQNYDPWLLGPSYSYGWGLQPGLGYGGLGYGGLGYGGWGYGGWGYGGWGYGGWGYGG
ncbi:MAG: hypothetical protein HYZ28_18775, partial [Myxococcales bacterium]|nr:hypothetical protein [Myxococcales bacterium]